MVKNLKKILSNQQGQSIVEYIILVATVIAALIVFFGRGGIFEKSYNGVVKVQGDSMVNIATDIFN